MCRRQCILPPPLRRSQPGGEVAFVIALVFLALQLVGYAAVFI